VKKEVRRDPGTSRVTGKHVTTRPLRSATLK